MKRKNRINDIKAFRAVTTMLGKLGIKCMLRTQTWSMMPGDPPMVKTFYGLGLAQCKAYIEGKYEYELYEP